MSAELLQAPRPHHQGLLADLPEDRTPASVTAFDLGVLARLIDCEVDELTSGLRRDQSYHARGRIAQPQEVVAFEAGESPPEVLQSSCDTALLSVASRPSVLDTAQAPKVLMTLAGEPVICHCLLKWLRTTQLGIDVNNLCKQFFGTERVPLFRILNLNVHAPRPSNRG